MNSCNKTTNDGTMNSNQFRTPFLQKFAHVIETPKTPEVSLELLSGRCVKTPEVSHYASCIKTEATDSIKMKLSFDSADALQPPSGSNTKKNVQPVSLQFGKVLSSVTNSTKPGEHIRSGNGSNSKEIKLVWPSKGLGMFPPQVSQHAVTDYRDQARPPSDSYNKQAIWANIRKMREARDKMRNLSSDDEEEKPRGMGSTDLPFKVPQPSAPVIKQSQVAGLPETAGLHSPEESLAEKPISVRTPLSTVSMPALEKNKENLAHSIQPATAERDIQKADLRQVAGHKPAFHLFPPSQRISPQPMLDQKLGYSLVPSQKPGLKLMPKQRTGSYQITTYSQQIYNQRASNLNVAVQQLLPNQRCVVQATSTQASGETHMSGDTHEHQERLECRRAENQELSKEILSRKPEPQREACKRTETQVLSSKKPDCQLNQVPEQQHHINSQGPERERKSEHQQLPSSQRSAPQQMAHVKPVSQQVASQNLQDPQQVQSHRKDPQQTPCQRSVPQQVPSCEGEIHKVLDSTFIVETEHPALRGSDLPVIPQDHSPNVFAEKIVVNNNVYAVINLLGTGGSSKVYQVVLESHMSIHAIKVVDLSEADPSSQLSYRKEVSLLLKLKDCARVIQMTDYEYKDVEKKLYIVMEKGDSDLVQIIREVASSKESMNSWKIKFYWSDMLKAVAEIHLKGIIHSDLKPANFIIAKGKLKLIDFGIASSLHSDMTSIVKDTLVGTVNYMSPESLCTSSPSSMQPGIIKLRPKSDVWSLGCMLYNLVYGHTPFACIKNQMVKMRAICDPHYKIKFPPCLDPYLLDVLKKCLERDPMKRPAIEELLAHPYLDQQIGNVDTLLQTLKASYSPNTLQKVSKALQSSENRT